MAIGDTDLYEEQVMDVRPWIWNETTVDIHNLLNSSMRWAIEASFSEERQLSHS